MKFSIILTVEVTEAESGADLEPSLAQEYIAKYFHLKNHNGQGVQLNEARLLFTVNEAYQAGRKFLPGARVSSSSQALLLDKYCGSMLRGLPDGHAFTVLEPPGKNWPEDATSLRVGRACWPVETRLLREVQA